MVLRMLVKSKTKSTSSRIWIKRQISDPFVRQARAEGYRSRAAYKLLEIQKKDKIFKKGINVVDLGAAPGGWSQVARECVGQSGKIVALDVLPMETLKGVDIVQGDFQEEGILEGLVALLKNEGGELVISDMAPNLSGIAAVDQARATHLAEMALVFSEKVLKKDGILLVKLFQGLGFEDYLTQLRTKFKQVVIRKPKASRAESREVYLLARGYLSNYAESKGLLF